MLLVAVIKMVVLACYAYMLCDDVRSAMTLADITNNIPATTYSEIVPVL